MPKPVKRVKIARSFSNNNDVITRQIVKEMWRLITRDEKDEIAIKLARSLRKSTHEKTAQSVFDWIKNNVPYKADPEGIEHLTAPIRLIDGTRDGEDCDGMIMLGVCLLRILGIPARIVTIAWRKHEFTHVVAQVKIKGKWEWFDPAYQDKFGITIDESKIKRYGVSNKPMSSLAIHSLEDGYMSGSQDLSDCGCGGKCGGCGKSKRKSMPQNVNIIVAGNESSDSSTVTNPGRGGTNGTHTIEKRFIPKEKIVEVPVNVEKKVFNPNSAKVAARGRVNESGLPVQAISTHRATFLYPFV